MVQSQFIKTVGGLKGTFIGVVYYQYVTAGGKRIDFIQILAGEGSGEDHDFIQGRNVFFHGMNTVFVQYKKQIAVRNVAGTGFAEEADFYFYEIFKNGTEIFIEASPGGFFFAVIEYDIDGFHGGTFLDNQNKRIFIL